jgi:hypothetical protein
MLNHTLLWNSVLGWDGKLSKEPTFLGAVLIVVIGILIGTALVFATGWAIAVFS